MINDWFSCSLKADYFGFPIISTVLTQIRKHIKQNSCSLLAAIFQYHV